MLVLDATPLIYLAKVRKVRLLADLPDVLVVPRSVVEEVVEEGRRRGEPDATRVGRLIEDGTLRVVDPPDTMFAKALDSNDRLDEADRDVLAVAEHRGARVLLDETYGRRLAEVEGLEHGGTIYLLLRLVEQDALTPTEMRETVDALIDAGWYCSTRLYARILRSIDEMK